MATAAIAAGAGPTMAEPEPPAFAKEARRALEMPAPRPADRRDFVMTFLRSTAVAGLRQPLTTARLGRELFLRRGRGLVEDNLPVMALIPRATPPPPGSDAFEALLDRQGVPRPLAGTVDLLIDGDQFFDEFEKQVKMATTSIDLQVFIFDNDDVAVGCADLLRGRAGEIPVRVLFDDLGTTFAHGRQPRTALPPGFRQPANIATYLERESPLEVRQTLNPWLVADHTKLLLFDEATAFLGGMNIGRESRHEWHDLMLRVRGPIVASLDRQFEFTWRKSGPRGDLILLEKPAPLVPGDSPEPPGGHRLLRTDAAAGHREIMDAMLLAIRGSRTRIWIETPYFSNDTIKAELVAAARRGVEVQVILPSRANHSIMGAGNLVTARRLLTAGAKVYQYPGMTHLKAMICDDWAMLGSANLDTLSLRTNRELNLASREPALLSALARQVMEPDLERSKLLDIKDTELLLAPLLESIADQF